MQFPDNFLWGASTSAHQVEGDTHNDWSEWEKKNADRLAKEAKNKYPPQNYISGRACDHYHLFEEDFRLAKSSGLNAYRFSIEWSRIEPEKNKFDQKEIEHYQRVVESLRNKNIEPFVTLWHWTIPLWLAREGGWKSKNIVDYFSRYTEKVVSALNKQVNFWMTLNEPDVYTSKSYLAGDWPPQEKSLISSWRVYHNLIKAHLTAYQVIKKINPASQVGIAKHYVYFEAYQNKIINRILKKLADYSWNFYFLNKIKDYQDFIGLNNYLHNRINYGFTKNEDKCQNDMGWELYPESIYYSLKELSKYKKPIYITENGLADAQDKYRAWYIKEIIKNIERAAKEGVNVRGYLHWSLLDNFEWDKGFWPRFGLIEVDYKNLERKVRPSALEYAKIIKNMD